jgi:hypothetical protein
VDGPLSCHHLQEHKLTRTKPQMRNDLTEFDKSIRVHEF